MSKQTVNTVSKFIDSCDNNSIYEINIEGTDVKIKRNLSLEERAKFVTLAATSCFDDDGMYLPELELFFWRYAIIKFLPTWNFLRSNMIWKYFYSIQTHTVRLKIILSVPLEETWILRLVKKSTI